MTAISKVAICNMALGMIGAGAIQSLSENSNNARKCNQFFDFVRDATLRDHPWNFATEWQTLALLDVDSEVAKWTYVYQYPTDCLRFLQLEDEDSEWQKITDRIYTNVEDAVGFIIKRVEDVARFDASFITAFATRMAAILAVPIRGKKTLGENLYAMYRYELDMAQTDDASEMNVDLDDDNRYVDARG